jgi:hypothetical protein
MHSVQRSAARAASPLPAAVPADARAHRGQLLKWLRKTHGWIGLWGAVLGLLFGGTGILLNHRSVLKIPAAQTQESTIQMQLPLPAPADPTAMAAWLSSSLGIAREASRVKAEPSKPVAWGDKALAQPARWSGAFSGPQNGIQFEYWVGNNYVTVKRNDNNVFSTLSNLHKGTGMGIGWILLVDTLAGSIILLSITGVLLWALMTKKRMVGTAIASVSLLATLGLAFLSL